ncbi:MAG: aspartate 1-decarboxylase [Dehalococcoidia bacterium]|nr:aspartate 1-decarboxylase [Dehalococcoidia bacterium]
MAVAKAQIATLSYDSAPYRISSVIIDEALMDKADLAEYEKVLICNVTNGNRRETYALPGEYGSGVVSVQGAGARLYYVGDCLIILSIVVTDYLVEPRMILVDDRNKFVEYIKGAKHEQPLF